MGFTTGFLSGTALTLGATYLALSAHRANRVSQAALLRSQTDALNRAADPTPATDAAPAAARLARRDLGRAHPGGVVETAKDRWNAQLAGEVRRLQQTDWAGLAAGAAQGVGAVWARLRRAVGEQGGEGA